MGKVHAGVFSRDLPWLMYGFGDADKPLKVWCVGGAVARQQQPASSSQPAADQPAAASQPAAGRQAGDCSRAVPPLAHNLVCTAHAWTPLPAVRHSAVSAAKSVEVTRWVCCSPRSAPCALPPPLQETVDLVEEIAIQYITDTVHTAMRAAAARNAGTSRYAGVALGLPACTHTPCLPTHTHVLGPFFWGVVGSCWQLVVPL